MVRIFFVNKANADVIAEGDGNPTVEPALQKIQTALLKSHSIAATTANAARSLTAEGCLYE